MAGTPFKMKGSPYPDKKSREQKKVAKKNKKLAEEKAEAEARIQAFMKSNDMTYEEARAWAESKG